MARLSTVGSGIRNLMRALYLLAQVRSRLSLVGFKATRGWLDAGRGNHPARQTGPNGLAGAFRAFNAASRLVPGDTCLVRAMAAERYFSEMGFPCLLKIGTRFDEDHRFESHAWLEYEGEVIVGGEISREFSAIVELERPH